MWPRLVVSLTILLGARYAHVVTRRRELRSLEYAAGLLVLRDLVALWLSPGIERTVLRVAAESGAYLLFLWWTGRYRRSNRSLVVAGLFTVVGWGLVAAGFSTGSPVLARVGLYALPVVLFVACAVAVYRVDAAIYRPGGEIAELRPWLTVVFVVQILVYLTVPLSFDVFEAVVAILGSLPLLIVPLYLVSATLDEERRRTRSLRDNGQALFSFLSGVGSSLGGGRDPEMILSAAAETMAHATGADGGIAVIAEAGTWHVCAATGLSPPPVPVPDIVKHKQGALRRFLFSLDISQETPLWGPALTTGEAVHIGEAEEHSATAVHAADRVLQLRSVLVLPLAIRDRVLGLISVLRRGDSTPFTTSDFDHAKTMADFVAVTLDNFQNFRVQRDIEIAANIQKRLQAPPVVDAGGLRFAGVGRPARGMSGDYYDVIPLSDDRSAVIICDVSGKGVAAALVMVMVRTIAHLALARTDDAGTVLELINAGVSGAVSLDRFATASVLVFDPRRERFSYANAAHHPAMMVGANDLSIQSIDADGLPIGIEENATYTSREVALPPGATVLLYTDGVIEAYDPHGEEYGEQRLKAAVQSLLDPGEQPVPPSSHELLQGLLSRLDEFVAGVPQHDDITMVVCRRPINSGEES